MKISIIGCGNVGGLTALRLSYSGIKNIVLIDALPNFAQAKAYDINDSRFIIKQNYHIQGTDDINQIAGSDIVIITAGIPRRPGMNREDLIQKNSNIIKSVCPKIKRLSPESIVIVVTNPLDAMTYLAVKETSFSPRRVLGMGLTLDRSRFANLIAEKLGIDVSEIEPGIIGAHGEGMLPLPRYTKIKSASIGTYLDDAAVADLFQRTVKRGAEIVSLFGSGSAYFAPSAAIAELVKAVVNDEKTVLPVSAYLNGEYGLNDVCIGVPCCLGRNGIEKIVELSLNDNEKTAFLKSAVSIKQQIAVVTATNKCCK